MFGGNKRAKHAIDTQKNTVCVPHSGKVILSDNIDAYGFN